MITRNLTEFSRPCSHFGIIFEQEEGKRGTLCIKHGTLSKVSHYITLHHIVSVNSIYILTSMILNYFDSIHTYVFAPFQRFIPVSAFYPHFSVLSPIQRFTSFQCFIPISVFIPISALYPHFSVLSPFQRFILISVFYPHFIVLSRFQFPFSVSVSAIQFQRFISTQQ